MKLHPRATVRSVVCLRPANCSQVKNSSPLGDVQSYLSRIPSDLPSRPNRILRPRNQLQVQQSSRKRRYTGGSLNCYSGYCILLMTMLLNLYLHFSSAVGGGGGLQEYRKRKAMLSNAAAGRHEMKGALVWEMGGKFEYVCGSRHMRGGVVAEPWNGCWSRTGFESFRYP